ncbi:MAG: bifunctional metallophosphatase/5'-nucleotidase [Prevotella sp.]|nr:bifunctional metallophosphatase/5'-nucleotidase [Prevotella sp.]
MLIPFFLFILSPLGTEAKKPKRLVVLHTNDTHSTILPVNASIGDTMKAGRGGFLRRIAMLKEERRQNPDLLLFDSGDFSQGSPYYTMYKGDVEIGLMNQMGYDAATIGNHEFDFGLDNMARLFRMANFPIICANYDFTGTVCEGLVKTYIILKRNGIKIGVFGLAPRMEGLVSLKNCPGVKYLDPVTVARETAELLKRKKKCDVVICVSHLGWKLSSPNDAEVINGSRYIDLVLGGHTHTYLEQLEYAVDLDGRRVPVDQNGKHAIFVGKMVLDF